MFQQYFLFHHFSVSSVLIRHSSTKFQKKSILECGMMLAINVINQYSLVMGYEATTEILGNWGSLIEKPKQYPKNFNSRDYQLR